MLLWRKVFTHTLRTSLCLVDFRISFLVVIRVSIIVHIRLDRNSVVIDSASSNRPHGNIAVRVFRDT